MRYYYMDSANQVAGPVEKEGLVELLKAKSIDKTAQICAEGAQEWGPITDVIKSKKKRGKRMTSAAMSGRSPSVGGTETGMATAELAEPVAEEAPAAEKKTQSAPRPSSRASSSPVSSSTIPGMPQEVVVLNMNISFGRMIALMLKWAFAAIPALIILAAVTVGLFMGLLKACPEMKSQCPFGFGHANQAAPPATKGEKKTPPVDATADSSGTAATGDTTDTSTSGTDTSGIADAPGDDDFDMSDIPLPDLPTMEQPSDPAPPKKAEPTTEPETPASTLPDPAE